MNQAAAAALAGEPNASAAVAAVNAPVGNVVAAGNVAIFTLNPSQVIGANAFIDYNNPASSELRKTYYKSIEPPTTPYDGSLKGLQYFMHLVETRAWTFGWNQDIFDIPVGNGTHSLFKNHGLIKVEDVRAHVATYIGTPTKSCQDAHALKLFLDGSLTEEFAMRVLGQRRLFTINNEVHGPTMYCVILSIVGIETAASLAVIYAKIHSLPATAAELGYNVTTFNTHVIDMVNDLHARGKEPQV
jgi:hypothetical protein